jgi:hypothetical protein
MAPLIATAEKSAIGLISWVYSSHANRFATAGPDRQYTSGRWDVLDWAGLPTVVVIRQA